VGRKRRGKMWIKNNFLRRSLRKKLKKLENLMRYEAEVLNFEKAAVLRDKIREIKKNL
jgi:excinuclease UvrABC helicase subunit UvrB